jgi:radical SAM superfamily enzyme YgiQ (UPF0313 family)
MKSLDLLLINPPSFYNDKENIWAGVNSNFPHLGIASIASYVRQSSYSVQVIDCNIVSPSVDQFERYFKDAYVRNYSFIRYIGLTAFTFNINKAYIIASICKRYYPNALILFGGTHATVLPDEVIQKKCVDIVVYGEGEKTCLDILKNISLADIKGILYKQNINNRTLIIKNDPQDRIINIDELPQPAYDLLPINKYRPAKGSYKRLPAMSMVTSRGCPGKCTFCVNSLGTRLVFKSASTIYNEIIYLVKNYGIKQLLFYDDTFTVNKANVIQLCDLIIDKGVDITWTCFARADFIDDFMLGKMKKAGCHQIMYGVENINPDVLNNIKKKINIDQIVNAVHLTKKHAIECRLAFMVGNPGDSEKIIDENIEFLKSIDPDFVVINITTPFPGTEMFAWAKKNNLILTYNWDDYTLSKPIMRLKNLDENQIKRLYKKMYRSFYFRKKYILRMLKSIRSFSDAKRLWDGFFAVFRFLN